MVTAGAWPLGNRSCLLYYLAEEIAGQFRVAFPERCWTFFGAGSVTFLMLSLFLLFADQLLLAAVTARTPDAAPDESWAVMHLRVLAKDARTMIPVVVNNVTLTKSLFNCCVHNDPECATLFPVLNVRRSLLRHSELFQLTIFDSQVDIVAF